MKHQVAIEYFASHFVIATFQDRFSHEALKKPHKLNARICHAIETVFESKYRGGSVEFEPTEPCIYISRSEQVCELSWLEASKFVGCGGILVISQKGNKFYAETEGEPAIQIWAGSC